MKQSSGGHGPVNQTPTTSPWNRFGGQNKRGMGSQGRGIGRAQNIQMGDLEMSPSEGRADSDRGGRAVKLADFVVCPQEKGLATSKGTSANCWNQVSGHNARVLSSRGRYGAMQRDGGGALTFSKGKHQQNEEEQPPFKGMKLFVSVLFPTNQDVSDLKRNFLLRQINSITDELRFDVGHQELRPTLQNPSSSIPKRLKFVFH